MDDAKLTNETAEISKKMLIQHHLLQENKQDNYSYFVHYLLFNTAFWQMKLWYSLTCSPGRALAKLYTTSANRSSSSGDQTPLLQFSFRSRQRSFTEAADRPRCAAIACQLLPCFMRSSRNFVTSSDVYFPMWFLLSYSLKSNINALIFIIFRI